MRIRFLAPKRWRFLVGPCGEGFARSNEGALSSTGSAWVCCVVYTTSVRFQAHHEKKTLICVFCLMSLYHFSCFIYLFIYLFILCVLLLLLTLDRSRRKSDRLTEKNVDVWSSPHVKWVCGRHWTSTHTRLKQQTWSKRVRYGQTQGTGRRNTLYFDYNMTASS